MTEPTAVLLMAYGTPYQESDIKGYYTNIRHGQEPPKPLMDQLVGRYKAIGLPSPLARITRAQRDGLQAALDKAHPGTYKVYEGLKYIAPFIKDAVDQIASDGITRVIGLPLAPQYSSYSSEDYHNRARKDIEAHPGIKYLPVRSWWNHQALIHFWSDQLVAKKDLTDRQNTRVIFSAHSLPLRIIQGGDPYKDEVIGLSNAVARAAGLNEDQYILAWQSAGRTQEPWIGPDFVKVAKDLITKSDMKTIVSASIGFIADNLEICYDVDIELTKAIESVGGTLTRLNMPNDSSALIATLQQVVEETEAE